MVLVVVLVCEYGPDINSFSIEMNNNDKAELVATNVKDDKLADLVDAAKRLLELRKVFKVPAAAKRKPTSERRFSFWMFCPELN
jgi:hypothetical protein